MNPLTLSYVRKHRLDPEVFRRAVDLLVQYNIPHRFLYTRGLCTVLDYVPGCWDGKSCLYIAFLEALCSDVERGAVFWWRCPDVVPRHPKARRLYVQEAYTPRVVALELAALFVEDLLASARAPGHNPDKLTNAQVGKGWRLLARKEIQARPLTPHIQSWGPGTRLWFGGDWRGSNEFVTYRTRKPAGYFLTR